MIDILAFSAEGEFLGRVLLDDILVVGTFVQTKRGKWYRFVGFMGEAKRSTWHSLLDGQVPEAIRTQALLLS